MRAEFRKMTVARNGDQAVTTEKIHFDPLGGRKIGESDRFIRSFRAPETRVGVRIHELLVIRENVNIFHEALSIHVK
jgi:hypothetical protein